jgi:hypothetical protein
MLLPNKESNEMLKPPNHRGAKEVQKGIMP